MERAHPETMKARLPQQVKIVEVGVRDGLQQETWQADVQTKMALIDRLVGAGARSIEIGALLPSSPAPRMAHTARHVAYSVLVHDLQGFEQALALGCTEVAVDAAASEAFSQREHHCSIMESLDRYFVLVEAAKENGVRVRAHVACAISCPYSGGVRSRTVANVAAALYEMGCYEISLGDTTGMGTPTLTKHLIEDCREKIPVHSLAGHFYDTHGMAASNIYAALESGVAVFDSAVAGLGDSPYSSDVVGNVATEDVVFLMQGLGIDTGIDVELMLQAGEYICDKLSRTTASRVAQALDCLPA
ncbi:MAG TPA: hydroxymethylglutaryl-CoA lyase [Noviherbaspirillum sp.]|nr:hydroxymethylglutaryl-CoA lyase [Noviherbaspirillum sp.]